MLAVCVIGGMGTGTDLGGRARRPALGARRDRANSSTAAAGLKLCVSAVSCASRHGFVKGRPVDERGRRDRIPGRRRVAVRLGSSRLRASVRSCGGTIPTALLDRVRRRLVFALIAAVLGGTLALLSAWLGVPGRFAPYRPARPLSQVWWYFPVYFAIGFALVVAMPKRFDDDLGL